MLTYQKSKGLEIIEYFEFEFVGCQDSKPSTSRYLYMLARRVISWKVIQQTLIVPSTIVAEFVTCFETSNHGIWLRNFVVNGIEKPLKIYCDNNLAILFSNNNGKFTKLKFIDIEFLVVKERVQNK
ncbi:Copia protein, partial [Mucuna pruriens]